MKLLHFVNVEIEIMNLPKKDHNYEALYSPGTRVAEWLALLTSDHKVSGSNPAEGGN